MTEIIEIPSDGATLSGTVYRPDGAVVAALIIHPAVGVPQGYYKAFCEWAAAQGRVCLTYDYRDVGVSAAGSLKQSRADMGVWGVIDQAAALAHLQTLAPGAPVHVIGHSLGGFMTPFHDDAHKIASMVTVASGQAYWRDHPPFFRVGAILFWWVLGPMLTRLLGYTPGFLLGGYDIPATVFWQWRRWCTRLAFYTPDIGEALPMPTQSGLKAPLKIIAFTDDPVIPPKSVARLAHRYPEAEITEIVIDPADVGLKEIGHLKAFSRKNRPLWPQLLPVSL